MRRHPTAVLLVLAASVAVPAVAGGHRDGGASVVAPRGQGAGPPRFAAAQAELFAAPGAQPNAWADYDGDGDLDLFVGFRSGANRLYRNDHGLLRDVAAEVGLADTGDTRVAAWGDIDGDGDLDLYVGFGGAGGERNRLYRNDAGGTRFADVAPSYGVDGVGVTRQASWIDYDRDGDLDLFVAFRDRPNHLFRNDGTSLTDVTAESGIGDPRRTVGVAWFDFDADGDLDAFVANQDGDEDGFFRNDGGRFTDVAAALGMHRPGRRADQGSVGPAVADYDNDGDLDLFVASYGPDVLWENVGGGRFRRVEDAVLGADFHSTVGVWGDYDNDGWIDLYVVSFLGTEVEAPDHLYRNAGGTFADVTPPLVLARGASHGASWADFDGDGDLDLALANNHPDGAHPLYRNLLPPPASARSLQVRVVDEVGRWRFPGAEVRLHDSGSGRLIGTRLLDAGGGYCSQGAAPAHFGIPEGTERVDVRVTVLTPSGRRVIERREVSPAAMAGRPLEVRVPW